MSDIDSIGEITNPLYGQISDLESKLKDKDTEIQRLKMWIEGFKLACIKIGEATGIEFPIKEFEEEIKGE